MTDTLRDMGDRVEAILDGIKGANPVTARAKGEELVRTIVELYGTGLSRILEIVHDAAGERAAEIFDRLAADKLVSGLMLLHGLHPLSLEERVHGALEAVRPYLKSHEGGVQITEIRDGVVYLRMEGSCNGCPSSAETVRTAIEHAILEAAPEITAVKAQGVRETETTLRLMSDWVPFPSHDGAERVHLDVNGTPALIMRNDDSVYAFRNQCPQCFRGLGAATIAWPVLTCGGCGSTYDLSGGPGQRLETFPVTADGAKVQLAIPVTS